MADTNSCEKKFKIPNMRNFLLPCKAVEEELGLIATAYHRQRAEDGESDEIQRAAYNCLARLRSEICIRNELTVSQCFPNSFLCHLVRVRPTTCEEFESQLDSLADVSKGAKKLIKRYANRIIECLWTKKKD